MDVVSVSWVMIERLGMQVRLEVYPVVKFWNFSGVVCRLSSAYSHATPLAGVVQRLLHYWRDLRPEFHSDTPTSSLRPMLD